MKERSKLLKIGKMLICVFIIINFINYSSVFAMTNSNYVEYALPTNNENSNSILSVITDIVLPIVLPFFTIIESLTSKIMQAVTGEKFFPWADLIIYNAIPFLDINFINPSEGSLFLDIYGNKTSVGSVVSNVYFSMLAICIAFLGIAVAVNVIKLIVTDIAGKKAKYKIMINKTIITVILLFGMHYLISFVFFLNEQMVTIASDLTSSIISNNTANGAIQVMNQASDKNNEKIVNNFFDDADHTSWYSPITIAKKAVKEIVNFFSWVGGLFSDDAKDDDTVTLGRDEKHNEPFPSKADYIKMIKDLDNGIDVAAYLIKDYNYRDLRLWSVAGNDTNKFSQSGIWGTLTSISNTVVWCTGLVDTGLQGLENLYNDVYFITVDMKKNDIIKSAKHYSECAELYSKIINDTTKSDDERNSAKITLLYINAYFQYVYDKDDKAETGVSNVLSNLGTFFKRNIYYVDVNKGDWSPSTFNAIPCILYCMFIFQSMMFLFSYVKRLFYIIILAIMGPVIVVYDYIMLSF